MLWVYNWYRCNFKILLFLVIWNKYTFLFAHPAPILWLCSWGSAVWNLDSLDWRLVLRKRSMFALDIPTYQPRSIWDGNLNWISNNRNGSEQTPRSCQSRIRNYIFLQIINHHVYVMLIRAYGVSVEFVKVNSLFEIVTAVSAQRHRPITVFAFFHFRHRNVIVQTISLRFDVDRIELEHDARSVRSDHVYPIV